MSEPDCSQTLHRIHEYLDGEMTPEDTRRIATHLAECAPCMEEHDVEAAVKAVLKRSCVPESAPVTLRAAIVRRITTIHIEYRD